MTDSNPFDDFFDEETKQSIAEIEAKGTIVPIPSGMYAMQFEHLGYKMNSNGNPMATFRFRIFEGPLKGKPYFQNMSFSSVNPQFKAFTIHKFKNLISSLSVFDEANGEEVPNMLSASDFDTVKDVLNNTEFDDVVYIVEVSETKDKTKKDAEGNPIVYKEMTIKSIEYLD